MKKFVYLLAVASLWGCSRDMNLYDPNYSNNVDNEVDYTKSFSLRTAKTLSIKAVDAEGNARQGVIFRIYSSLPYTESGENNYDVTPLCAAATDASGSLMATFEIPSGITTLYVVPGTSAVGQMQTVTVQENMSLNFDGAILGEDGEKVARSAKATRADVDLSTFDRAAEGVQVGQGVFNLFVPYSPAEFKPNGTGKYQTQFNIDTPPAGSLASKETITSAFDYLVQQWYPERENLSDLSLLDKSSDMVVTDVNGANVWATYVGDYGFANTNEYSILGYYNYKDGEEPVFDEFVSGDHKRRITVLFSNTLSKNLIQGTKVQLLYWDGEKYSTTFPKDTHIGFVFFRGAFRFGFKGPLDPNAYQALKDDTYSTQALVSNTNNARKAFFTTPSANRTGKANGVARWCEEYHCSILGMDGRFFDDPSSSNDKDFNDAVVKLESNPIKAVKPENEIPVDETEIPNGKEEETNADGKKTVTMGDKYVYPSEYLYGTLAFEDAWPKEGDYDFNDVVVKYEYGLEKNYLNQVTGVYLKFTPLAMGAISTNGFGIELPILSSYFNKNIVESGNDGYATVIVFNNGKEAFPATNGAMVNTYDDGSSVYKGTSFIYHLNLKEPVSVTQSGLRSVKLEEFNPFIFVNKRSHEVHLTNKAPTKFMDTTLFNTEKDKSIPASGYYYHMDNEYPWAVDIPRKEASSSAWHYPYEHIRITDAYKNYFATALWYDWTKSGNADAGLLALPVE